MTPNAVLILIVAAPVALLMLLRINAALVFLSLCLGSVLVSYVGRDASSLSAIFQAHAPQVDSSSGNVSLLLLLLPVVLTMIFMIKTVHGKGKLILNLLPALGVGLLGSLIVVPLLPAGLSNNIVNSDLWVKGQQAQTLIVGFSAIICLLSLWLQRPKGHEGKHGKHHKG